MVNFYSVSIQVDAMYEHYWSYWNYELQDDFFNAINISLGFFSTGEPSLNG